VLKANEEVLLWISTGVPCAVTYTIQSREIQIPKYLLEHLLRNYPMIGCVLYVERVKICSRRWKAMAVRKIKEGIYEVGAIDWDRRLFDELIPLPDGTSYNSYLVMGKEKIALIDTVDPSKERVLIENIEKLNIERIDYIVSNHAEQDHSGSIPVILEMFSDSKVVTNPKAKEFLMDLLHVPEERFLLINEGETLDLEGRTLKFFMTPWVHWPETMVTYLVEDKILFTCDFFGSHLATSKLFADE